MRKTHYFATRVAVLLIALFLYALICMWSVIVAYTKIPDQISLALLIALGIFGVLLAIVFFHWIQVPYRRLQHIQRMFVNDQLYDELLHPPVALSEENEKVLEHFRYLLSKQDMIDLSKKQAEYLALQNQINPHFLYNTLEAIRGDALSEGALAIAQTTEALSTFFRYTITETGNLVTVANELENIENYFTIQRYRFGDKLQMDIVIDDDDPIITQYQIPKLTLQPIIENAIYHGLENKVEGGLITVRLQTTEKRLLINISDNGVGMDREDVSFINQRLEKVALSYISDNKKKHGGIALRNVTQRIKLLFGEEYGVRLYSIMGMGTEVHIHLPKLASADIEDAAL